MTKRVSWVLAALALLPTAGNTAYFGFGAGGGFALPIGSYADAAGLSPAAAGEFTISFTPRFYMNVRGAYRLKHAGKTDEFSTEGEYKSVILQAGPGYRFDYYPFVLYGAGAAGISRNDFTYPYLDASGIEHSGRIQDFRPLVYGGAGLEYRMTQNVSIDLSLGVSTMFNGDAPGGTRAALKKGVLITADFYALLKYYIM